MDRITELTINTYNNIAQQYTRDFFYNEDGIKFVNKFIEYIKGNKVLDVGCGSGGLTKEFIKHNYDITGIDLSEKMIEIAKQKVPNVKFEIQDIRKTNFECGAFNALLVYRSLIHIKSEEIQKTLKEFYRLLKNDGVIGIVARVSDKPFEQMEKEVYNPNLNIFFKYFSEKEMQEELIKSSFSIEYSIVEEVKVADSREAIKEVRIIARKGV